MRKPYLHKKNVTKNLRNYGERYVNEKGDVIESKLFSEILCNCKMKCHEKNLMEQRQLFQSFWKLGDFVHQNTYICGKIQRNEIKQRRPRKEGGLGGYNKYFLKLSQGISVVVCKQ